MAYRTGSTSNLDFEDLVEELARFEQDARTLKDRIACFMDDAKQAADNGVSSPPEAHTGSAVQDGAAS